MKRRTVAYNADPAFAPVPLSVEEATVLSDDPDIVTKRDLPHLLRRVLATAVQVREMRRTYDDELRRRTAALPRPGLQPTLSPEQAARFLSPEQKKALFDRFAQEQLAALELLQERAAAEADRLAATVDDAVAIIGDALADATLDPATRSRLDELLMRLRRLDTGDELR